MSVPATKQDAYPLGRNTLAAVRLDLQHYMWTQSLGYHLHPSIRLPENSLIADVGCGTAIWSLTLPVPQDRNVNIEAFDISLEQTPPAAWLPSHVRTRQLDIFADPFPEELIERFDIIHVRLFLLVVRNNDPRTVLRNLLKMLKPNGYLQWQEYDPTTSRVVTTFNSSNNSSSNSDEKIATHHAEFVDLFNSSGQKSSTGKVDDTLAKITPAWPATFHELFDSSTKTASDDDIHATLVTHRRYNVPLHLLPFRHEANILGGREWAAGLRAVDPAAAAKFDTMMNAVEEECWNDFHRGAAIDSDLVVWVVKNNA